MYTKPASVNADLWVGNVGQSPPRAPLREDVVENLVAAAPLPWVNLIAFAAFAASVSAPPA